MYSITYVSAAVPAYTERKLNNLFVVSRLNNEKIGITGMLLYKGGNIMQTIEGPESSVRSLFTKIGRNKSHRHVITLLSQKVEERQFPAWRMAFSGTIEPEPAFSSVRSDFLDNMQKISAFATSGYVAKQLMAIFANTLR